MTRIRGLTVFALFITLFAITLSVVAVGVQAGQSSHVFDDFDGCTMPCWKGIQPGVTTQADAITRLDAVMGFPTLQVRCSLRSLTYCLRYTWMPLDTTALAAELQIVPGQYEMVVVYNPGFTVGEALLALDRLHVDFYGASSGFVTNQRFYVQLLFADSRLALGAAAACPGSYLDLIQAPVRSIEANTTRQSTPPELTSFLDVRKSFDQLCGAPA